MINSICFSQFKDLATFHHHTFITSNDGGYTMHKTPIIEAWAALEMLIPDKKTRKLYKQNTWTHKITARFDERLLDSDSVDIDGETFVINHLVHSKNQYQYLEFMLIKEVRDVK